MSFLNSLKCKFTNHKFYIDKISDPFEMTNLFGIEQAVNITYKCINCGITSSELTKYKMTDLYKNENLKILKKLIEESMLDDGIYNLGELKIEEVIELIDNCKSNYFISFRKQNNDLIAAIIFDDRPREMIHTKDI